MITHLWFVCVWLHLCQHEHIKSVNMREVICTSFNLMFTFFDTLCLFWVTKVHYKVTCDWDPCIGLELSKKFAFKRPVWCISVNIHWWLNLTQLILKHTVWNVQMNSLVFVSWNSAGIHIWNWFFFFYFYCTMKTRESELKVEMSSGNSDVVILPKPSDCQVAWREASRW